MSKSDIFLKRLSLSLMGIFFLFTLPLLYLNEWSSEHTKPISHTEYIDNNISNYLKSFPNKEQYIDYVRGYHVKNPSDIVDSILLTSYYNNLDPKLLFAIAAAESSFNVNAHSFVGAKGILQVMPFWKGEIGDINDNLNELNMNLHYGSIILKMYLEKSDNNLTLALAKYNGSKGSNKYPLKIFSQAVWMF